MKFQQADIVDHLRRHLSRFARSAKTIDPDGSVIEWFEGNGFAEEEIDGFFCWVNVLFGVHLAAAELEQLFGLTNEESSEPDCRVTFCDLATLIRSHLQSISFRPIDIASSICGKAGAFLAIKSIAEKAVPDLSPIGPSTKISSVLTGEALLAFWSQIEFYSQKELPRIRKWGEVQWVVYGIALIYLSLSVLVGLAGARLNINMELLVPWVLVPAVSLLTSVAFRIEDLPYGPVPRPFRTFRDLAEFVCTRQSPDTAISTN